MTYYVTQYGTHFFTIRRVNGYAGNLVFNGTKITEKEYKKLWNSTTDRIVIPNKLVSVSANGVHFDEVRIKGIASEILGRELNTVKG